MKHKLRCLAVDCINHTKKRNSENCLYERIDVDAKGKCNLFKKFDDLVNELIAKEGAKND